MIPDYLSRPKEILPQPQQNQLKENTRSIPIFTDTHKYPLIMMNEPIDRRSASQNLHEFPLELLKIQPITPFSHKILYRDTHVSLSCHNHPRTPDKT